MRHRRRRNCYDERPRAAVAPHPCPPQALAAGGGRSPGPAKRPREPRSGERPPARLNDATGRRAWGREGPRRPADGAAASGASQARRAVGREALPPRPPHKDQGTTIPFEIMGRLQGRAAPAATGASQREKAVTPRAT